MRHNGRTIGINGSMLDHQPSGIGIYSINLINHLFALYRADAYNRLTVFTPSRDFLHPDLHMVKLLDVLQSSRYGKLAAFSRFFWNTFVYPFQARKCDVLLSPTTHASFVLRNQILTIHDLLSLRFGNINAFQRMYFKYVLPLLMNRAVKVIAISQATKRDIVEFLHYPGEKIEVVYNGYDQSLFNVTDDSEGMIAKTYGLSDYFLVIGPTYAHKNILLVLDVYKSLPESTKIKHPLVITGGKRPYLTVLEQYVRQLMLEKHVHFLGYVPQTHMPQLYREAFALLFPSLHEGFGFPLLEAMACGCPVICSNTSSMPEVCGDAALYINPLKKMSLFKAITRLEITPRLHMELRAKGLSQAKKFSWEQAASELKSIIDINFNNKSNR
ncbi:MAG: glycosyltransferase family 4 protein [Chitinophagaceae bacterium]|nr:glycosyltransferase family 4 protein [Chitinophagaceae bacterium]